MYLHFYRCNVCGQIIAIVKGSGAPLDCCNEEMELITPNEVDAIKEKHIPMVEIRKNKVWVRVGTDLHPSTIEHHIEWIAIETNKGMQLKRLRPYDKPEVTFYISNDEKVLDVFAYCNLHLLWKKEIDESIY